MPSIKKNFLYSSILTVSGYLFPLITYPYISRVLGVANIGLCNFIDSIINYFVLFSMLGIGVVGVREIAKNKADKESLSLCFRDMIVLNLAATFIAEVILLASAFLIPQLYAHKEMVFIGALKLLANVFLIEWFYKGMEQFRYITLRSIIIKTLYVISVFLFVRGAEDYAVYYLLLTGMYVLNALLNWTYLRHFLSFTLRSANVFRYGKTIAVMGCYSILTSMYTTFNVVYLGFVAGEEEVGYYTTATKLYALIMALFTAFTGVMLPRMSALAAEGKMDEFNRLTDLSCSLLFRFSLPLVAFTVIYTPEIIFLISGRGYEGAVIPMRIVMPLMLVIGYEQIVIVQTLMPLKKDKAVFINSIIGATIGLALNFLLVPYLRSVGSAIVWVCSEVSVLLAAQYFVFKYLGKTFPLQSFLKEVCFLLPVLFFCGLFFCIFQRYAMIISILFMAVYYSIYYKFSTLR